MKQKILYCLIFFIVCLFAQAQTKNFFFKTLTTKDGLSYNLSNCLFQDSEGYIWIGTFNGLNRYDGSGFVVFKYDRNNPQSIAHNFIIGICEDKHDDIWVATQNGVSRYNKRKNVFTNYLLDKTVKDKAVANIATNILCDRQGTVWAGSEGGGLFMFDSASSSFISYKSNPANVETISSNVIERNSLLEDPKQNFLWIGTDKGLNCFDLQKKVFYNYKNNPQHLPVFNDDDIAPLAFDKNYRLVFCDFKEKKIIFYSVQNKTATSTDEVVVQNIRNTPHSLNTIFFDSKNNGWFGSWGNMIYYHDNLSKSWYPVQCDNSNPYSITSDFFWSALEAKDGTIFIAGNYGLSLYHPNDAASNIYKPALVYPSLKENLYYHTIAEDSSGKVWFSASGLGLFSYDFSNSDCKQYLIEGKENSNANKVVYAVYIKNKFWLSTKGGLYVFDPATKKSKRIYFDKPNPELPGIIYHDSKNNIWIGSEKWLYKLNPETESFKRYNPDSEFLNHSSYTYITSVTEDKNGKLWFGAASGQLYNYDLVHDQFTAYAPDINETPKILKAPIADLYADDNGKVWMATSGGGLIRFDTHTKKFKAWMENDGLIIDVCNKLIHDKDGRLWVSSYDGFTIFNIQDEKIEISKVDAGLHENDFFSTGRLLLKNGKIVVADRGNLVVIDPAQINIQHDKPLAVITGITIFNKSIPLYQTIRSVDLSYKENFFTINFSSLSSFTNGEIEYAYKLTSYDNDWNYNGRQNFAAYTGVAGGQYQFEVKAKYKQGDWGNVITLPVYIQPPFWETWWFRSLIIVLVIAIFLIIIKRREKRLLKKEKLQSEFRERITASEMQALRSQMNPHFLYNSLNAIRLFVLQNDSDNAEKYLVKFARLMRLILDNSREELINLNSELEQLRLYMELEQLRFDNKFDFTISVDTSLQSAKVTIPPMILQPYVENAILHGMAHKQTKGYIQVCIASGDHQLECIIEDNGVGREKAMQLKNKISSHRSVGLKVTEERLQLITLKTGKQTNVQVRDLYDENKIASGTKVIIHLPLIMQ